MDERNPQFPRAVLAIAAEVEVAERRIKDEILSAAAAGDCARVTTIVEAWLNEPPAEVLSRALIDASDLR